MEEKELPTHLRILRGFLVVALVVAYLWFWIWLLKILTLWVWNIAADG